jgi:hypothetical protein
MRSGQISSVLYAMDPSRDLTDISDISCCVVLFDIHDVLVERASQSLLFKNISISREEWCNVIVSDSVASIQGTSSCRANYARYKMFTRWSNASN